MYFDGLPVHLIQDPDLTGKCWDVVGAFFRSTGYKVQIHTLGIDDLIWDEPGLPVEYEDDYSRRHREATVERLRKEAKDGHAESAR